MPDSPPGSNRWYVYILQCADSSLYTGVTVEPERRVLEHNQDNKLGARYTRGRRPVSLVYQEVCDGRASATRREAQIKKMSRRQKLALIQATLQQTGEETL